MTRRLRKPLVDLIKDINIRESLQWIYEYILQIPILRGDFKFFEVTFNGAVTDEKIPHNLGFTPKDIISLSSVGTGAATFQYAKFTSTNLVITTTGACVIRFFAGRYQNEL